MGGLASMLGLSHFPGQVARVVKAGSVGKGTSLHLKIDFDCVFFLEPGGIPDRFLEDMEDILTLNFGIAAEKKQKSLSFSHKGFYFDFLPAQSAQAVKGARSSGQSAAVWAKARLGRASGGNGSLYEAVRLCPHAAADEVLVPLTSCARLQRALVRHGAPRCCSHPRT